MSRLILIAALLLLLPIQKSLGQTEAPRASAGAVNWVLPAVDDPRLSHCTFESAAAGTKVSYEIYLPDAYENEPNRRFPVVYWLHGSGGGSPSGPARLFDRAISDGDCPPIIVVFVNGLTDGMYVDRKDGSAALESVIVHDLVPHIDNTYRTEASREGRFLDGFSMGGYGAARLGFKFPGLFGSVSIVGGGPLQEELNNTPRANRKRSLELLDRIYGGEEAYFRETSPRTLAKTNAKSIATSSRIRIIIGDKDETYPNNVAFHEHLKSLGIPHEWTVLPDIDHDPAATINAAGKNYWKFFDTSNHHRNAVEINLSFDVGTLKRNAIVVNASTDDSKRPVIVVLHGGMGNAANMRTTSGFDELAKSEGFMVAYAQGTNIGGDRHAWNTGHLLRRQVQGADDIAYFDALIDLLVREHHADQSRIYMTGGSNGGMMTFAYAIERPEKLAAIAPVVASMFSFEKSPATPLPILIINGGKDREVPAGGGMSDNPIVRNAQATPFKAIEEVVDFWVKANRSTTPPVTSTNGSVTTETYSSGPEGAITEFVFDSEGGHGWPGTTSRRAGNASISAFKGAERVWMFFKDKRREHTSKP